MKKIIVLGAGMVGSAIAIDLCKNYKITSVDNNLENLGKLNAFPIKTLTKDLSDPKVVQNIVADFDLVIGAVPGFMGFQTLKAVIEAEKNIVDISFFPENPFELDTLAKEKKVTAVMDCGVAPGMSNLILGYHNQRMEIDNFECYVGGLPFIRKWPYEYKAPFSPIDVIEEYIRPSRIMENGEIVIKPALSEPELIDFPRVGTLESFNSDGLRSIIYTTKGRAIKLTHYIDLHKRLYGTMPEDIHLFVRTLADVPITMKDEIMEILKEKGWKERTIPDPTLLPRLIRKRKE